jgi:hypothetical protein
MSSKKKSGHGTRAAGSGSKTGRSTALPQFITDDIVRLFGDLTTPETPVKFSPPSRASTGSIENTIRPPAAWWNWADEATRTRQVVTAIDIGKYGYQADVNTLFKLTSVDPSAVWQAVHDFTTASWMWRNQAERDGLQVKREDLGKVGYQADINTYYQLTGATPPVWQAVPDPTRTSSPFELSTGASDAESYHDFYRLQIAFEDVWIELLDQGIATTAEDLYAKFDHLMGVTSSQDGGKFDRQMTFSAAPVDEKASVTAGESSGAAQLQYVLTQLKLFLGLPADGPAPSTSLLQAFTDLKSQVVQALQGCNMLLLELNRAGGSKPDLTHSFWDPNAWLLASPGNPDQSNPADTMSAYPPGTARKDAFKVVVDQLVAMQLPTPGETPGVGTEPTLDDLVGLITKLDTMLKERYRFDVFAPASINYGQLVQYRQKWTPQSYQVGNLVSTIPLAPQETRKYTTRVVNKKSRSAKEIENALRSGRNDSSDTSRVDAEIVDRAKNQTSFQTNAHGSYGNGELYKVEAGMQLHNDQAVESAQTKREFREAVVKATQEYRNENRMEVTSDESGETESTSTQEIRNPNDELTVTYLFYELQRRYLVDESLFRITPVIFVANEVPAPHEIDPAWLLRYDWILKRTILDNSFLPALDYLAADYTGENVTLQTLEMAVQHQKIIVDRVSQQILVANSALDSATAGLLSAQNQQVGDQQNQETFALVKSFFDPLNLASGQKLGGDGNSDRARVDLAKDALQRAQAKSNQLLSDMKSEASAFQIAIDKYTAAATRHFGMLAEIDRLRLHVKDNIIYYMQAIWTYEPTDQRYFRLYNLDTPVFAAGATQTVVAESDVRIKGTGIDVSFVKPILDTTTPTKKLHQVANLDNLLGFKGNYMIFPLIDFDNYLTWYLIHRYLDFDVPSQTVSAKDPDPNADWDVSLLQTTMATILEKQPDTFAKNEQYFEETMVRLLSDKATEMVIVPSKSLYIEALPGTHPLLEDFKLIHRALDVKKVQAEVRKAELENLRLAARLEQGAYGDPDIDKVVVVGNNESVTVDAGQ